MIDEENFYTVSKTLKCRRCEFVTNTHQALRSHYIRRDCSQKFNYALVRELEIFKQMLPNMDIDILIIRYLNGLDTNTTLKNRGINLDHLLAALGILRTTEQEKNINWFDDDGGELGFIRSPNTVEKHKKGTLKKKLKSKKSSSNAKANMAKANKAKHDAYMIKITKLAQEKREYLKTLSPQQKFVEHTIPNTIKIMSRKGQHELIPARLLQLFVQMMQKVKSECS